MGSERNLGRSSYNRVLKALARNMRVRRAHLRISQKELAERMQTSQNQVSMLENHRHEPLLGTLAKLADALDCSVSALLQESGKIRWERDYRSINGVLRRRKRRGRERAQQAEVAGQDNVRRSV